MPAPRRYSAYAGVQCAINGGMEHVYSDSIPLRDEGALPNVTLLLGLQPVNHHVEHFIKHIV
jgi:hypothetical protein